jgi:hypothetical protein
MAMPAFATNGRGDFIYTDERRNPLMLGPLCAPASGAACASSKHCQNAVASDPDTQQLRVAIVHTPTGQRASESGTLSGTRLPVF